MKPRFVTILLLAVYIATQGQAPKAAATPAPKPAPVAVIKDTAIVKHYNGIPVFFHCMPLHPYTTVGIMERTTLVAYSSKAFEKYAKAARRHNKGHIGIMIDNLNFGTDSFKVVQFAPTDNNVDTAVFSTPIFLSAKPTKPYKVVRVLNDEVAYGSLNTNLQRYLNEAGSLHIPYDGIMLKDINYGFKKDNIFVFRWKK